MQVITSRAVRRLVAGALVLAALFTYAWLTMIRMPEPGPGEPAAPPDAEQAEDLRRRVETLADDIGERHIYLGDTLARAAAFATAELEAMGYAVRRQTFDVDGVTCANLEVEIPGGARADEIVVVGAHYDSVPGTPGADDNASGVAGLLALAATFREAHPDRTLRFVAFANEEPPFYRTEDMGSLVYARAAAAAGENIVAMLSLEMLGYYSDEPGSQSYPFPLSLFYPSVGNFITFVGNRSSRGLVRQAVRIFREAHVLPAEAAVLPGLVTGVGFSDHWSFWQVGYPAIMVSDTAFFRNHAYHTPDDTSVRLDYERMARATAGLERVIRTLTSM